MHNYYFLLLLIVKRFDRSELSIFLEFLSNSSLDYTRKQTIKILEKIHEKFYIVKTATTVGFKNAFVGQFLKVCVFLQLQLY